MNAGPRPDGPDAGKRPEDLRGGARIRMLHVDKLGGGRLKARWSCGFKKVCLELPWWSSG